MTYAFLQQYWWAIISLLGALLVLMLFVQGGNTLLFQVGRTEEERRMMLRATGRKWELTFTTLVTFGGAFFAAFPLFYSTSFGGAYWLWMLILFSFVLQAVSYEFQTKLGNLLGANTYRLFLIINGEIGPLLLGVAVATFFTGANFVVVKENLCDAGMPVISRWANTGHGLDALHDVRCWLLGVALFFLARVLGGLYYIQRLDCPPVVTRCRRLMRVDALGFLIPFVAFLVVILTGEGYAVADTGRIYMEPQKYLHNLIEMPLVALLLVAGVAGVLYGLWRTLVASGCEQYRDGIFPVGAGVVLAVFALLLMVGYNGTAYYPSAVDPQSSLTLENSSASAFTLRTMFYVSLLVPFVLAYIVYVWRALEGSRIDADEVRGE
jgi:cytochrome d ubiquinol oxidase subunit II